MTIRFGLRDANAAPAELHDGIVLYPHALSRAGDLDGMLIHRPSSEGTEDFVLFQARPAREELRYRVELTRGVAGLRLVENILEFLDAGGAPRLRISPPFVLSRVGHEVVRVGATLSTSGCIVQTSSAPPWNRPVLEPGASVCDVTVSWRDQDVRYPALVDPVWSTTGSLAAGRNSPLTRLADGRVIAVGDTPVCEIYDPTTGTWAATAALPFSRRQHTVTLLADGRVLAAGGDSGVQGITADLLDLSAPSPSWVPVGSNMANSHHGHTATLLLNGKVLIAMGHTTGTTELYDPAATGNPWSSAGSIGIERANATAIRVPAGHVLVAGGTENSLAKNSVVLYPVSGSGWQNTSSMSVARSTPYSALVGNQVFITGGSTSDNVDRWNVTTGSMTQGPTLTSTGPSRMVQLSTGELFDYEINTSNPFNELFDPVATKWWSMPGIPLPNNARGVALADGRLLIAGGGTFPYSTAAYLFDPSAPGAFGGGPCTASAVCKSGFCTEGVCCDTACNTTCVSCLSAKTALPSGQCSPIVTNTDPDSECLDDGAPTCGGNGLCNGAGACGTYSQSSCVPNPCSSGTECTSGHCVDGICCDTACNAPCQGCTAAVKGSGSDGVCGFIGDGSDPQGECGPMGVTACAGDSVCNGSGSCRAVTQGSICSPATCAGAGSQNNPWKCNAFAECTAMGVSSCFPYSCQGTACVSSCTGASDCAAGTLCIGNLCVAQGQNGSPCSSATQCTSGWCVEGVCCASICDGECDSCLAANKAGGSSGVCGPRKGGAACGAPPTCLGPTMLETNACNGLGTCVATQVTCSTCSGGTCIPADGGAPDASSPDAAGAEDSGADASPTPPDASGDATVADSGADADTETGAAGMGGTAPTSDSGSGGTAGSAGSKPGPEPEDDSGCGCRTTPASPSHWWLLVLTGLLFRRTRRRAASPVHRSQTPRPPPVSAGSLD